MCMHVLTDERHICAYTSNVVQNTHAVAASKTLQLKTVAAS